MKTQKTNPNLEPALIELHDPDGAKNVRKLLDCMEVRREDDTPEEAAIRLSAMALMLSNIAARHRTALRAQAINIA